MRRAARIDANQPEIVKALISAGCSVAITSSVGDGFTDLVVSTRTKTALIEIKDGSKPPSQRQLTPDQKRFHANWKGEIHVVNSIDEALRAMGLIK